MVMVMVMVTDTLRQPKRPLLNSYCKLSTTSARTGSHRDERVGTAAALKLVLLAVERTEVLVADDGAGLRADVLRAVPAAETTLTENNEGTASERPGVRRCRNDYASVLNGREINVARRRRLGMWQIAEHYLAAKRVKVSSRSA